jgi:uncharacterized protein (TIGR00106 family)
MVLAEFSMFPTDKGESVSTDVAKVLDVVDQSGIPYQLTPMGTILEGSWENVFHVISKCFHVLEKESHRISVSIKVDYRKDQNSRMHSKIEKLEKLLDRQLRKE